MTANKLMYEASGVEITVFALNADRRFRIAKILPMIDGRFYLNSKHLQTPLKNYYKTTDEAKKDLQKLFEKWLNNFYCA